MTPKYLLIALICAIAFPIAYFAVQLIAAPFYMGYDFARQAASDLGSAQSRAPAVFNIGSLCCGALGLVGAAGLAIALPTTGVWRPAAWLFAITVAAAATSAIWAGTYPLPDPRHGANPFAVGLFAVPVIAALTLWAAGGPMLRAYVVINLLAFAALAALIGSGTLAPEGWVQRLLALIAFGPSFAAGVFALRALTTISAHTLA